MYRTIDSHVAGEAVRLLVEGAPAVKGRTMVEKLAWLKKHAEPVRRALMLEPRGHAGMHGALFTEPVSPTGHAGILFMNAGSFPAVSGEAVMAAVAMGIEHDLLHVESDVLQIDTPAGLVTAEPHRLEAAGKRVDNVRVGGLPGIVQAAAVPVQIGGRTVRADVAFAGESYWIVDSEAAGVSVDIERAPELIRVAARIVAGLDHTPGVIFTSPARHDGHLRTATVLEGGVLRRSPGVTGTIAVMAVLDAMGILEEHQPFINEGLVGTTLEGRVIQHQTIGDKTMIAAVVDGAVAMTGRHEFINDDAPKFII